MNQCFYVLLLLCLGSLLHTSYAQLNRVYNCTIDSVLDNSDVDYLQCDPEGTPGHCNFRNAIAFCNEHLDNFVAHTCNINFPNSQTIVLNETFGELIIWRAVGTLVLEGNGCVVTTPLYSGMRFLTVFDPVSVAGQLDFHMSDMYIDHFGNDTVRGGAIQIRDTKSSIFRNVTFARCHAGSGGALNMERNDNVTFVDVIFMDNVATGDGGAINLARSNRDYEFNRCQFIRNIADGTNDNENPGRGGAIFMDTSNQDILMVDCLFEFNLALRGASLCLNDRNVRISFHSTLFRHNVAGLHSGGVYSIYDNTDTTFLNSTFFNNSAGDGPAVRIWSGNDRFVVLGCNFSNNHASSEGGAIFVYSDNRDLSFIDSTFERNTAVGSGGAIYIDSGNTGFVFLDCSITGNVGERGGGIYVGSVNGEFQFTRVIISENVALGYGGGMSFVSLNNVIVFTNCVLVSNVASSGGAAHFAMDNSIVTMRDTTVSDNRVDLYGGGIYFGQEHVAIRLIGMSVYNNRADSGAGMYIGQFNFDVVVKESNFSHNEADEEGGGFFSSASEMELYDSIFTKNSAYSSAGMMLTFGDNHAIRDKRLIFENCIITHNHASTFGGLNIEYGSNLNIQGCLFQNNTGVIYDCGGLGIRESYNCSISNTLFDANHAGLVGGALHVKDTSDVNMQNVTFASNAAGLAGAIYFEEVSKAEIQSIQFIKNSAEQRGGALWLERGSDVHISHTTFISNVVVFGNGAAIYTSFSIVSIRFCTFTENIAGLGAGAVYWVYQRSMGEPSGLRDGTNVFARNNASYGNDWATEGIHVELLHTTLNYTDYTDVAPPVLAFITDFYNETAKTESEAFVEVGNLFENDCYDSSGFVSGDVIQRVKNGVATFMELIPNCAPGYEMEVTFTASIPTTQAVLKVVFRECVTGEFYGDSICQPCANGSYSFVDPTDKELSSITSSICESCPSQADQCFKDTMLLKTGHWRISETSQNILECPVDSTVACVGGSLYGDGLCGNGYTGALCAVCADGYTISPAQTCEECTSERIFYNPLVLFCLIVTFLCGLFLFISWRQIGEIKSFDHFVYFILLKLRIMTANSDTDSAKEIQNLREIRLSMQTRVSIYGTFFQIVAVLPYVLDLKLPDSFNSMQVGCSNFLNLSLSHSSLWTCDVSESYDFIDSLLVDTLMPLVILLGLVISYQIHSMVLLRQAQANGKTEIQKVIQNNKVRGSYIKFFLIYSVIILPYVSVQIFKTFSCQDVDADDETSGTHLYLRADYSISCTTARYDFARAWASCAIVLYIVILPLCYYYLLSQAKTEIARFNAEDIGIVEVIVSDKLQPLYFLFRKYRSEYWYFEIVELYFRVSITGFLVLFEAGSFLQIEVGFLLVFLYARLYSLCDPYKDGKLQALKVITLWQLFFIFHVAFLIRGEELQLSNNKTAIILFVLCFACLLFDTMLAALQHFSEDSVSASKWMNTYLPSYLLPASNCLTEVRNTETLRRDIKEFQSAAFAETSSSVASTQSQYPPQPQSSDTENPSSAQERCSANSFRDTKSFGENEKELDVGLVEMESIASPFHVSS